MYVRCAFGRFPADRGEAVATRLREVQDPLSPAIRALPGLIDYYAGIDRAERRIVSVSVWASAEQAEALRTLPAAIEARDALAAAGVTWEPVVAFPVTWWAQSA